MRRTLCMITLVGCGPGPDEPAPPTAARPNLLVVTLDTTRVDRLGPYGFGLARTPTLDRLAREGARFDDHATVAPITLPAHISVHTGLLPPAHGVRDNGAYALDDSVPTLAEQLAGQGWDTAAFVSAAVLDSRYNLDQGFELYDDDLWGEDAPAMFLIRDRPARATADRVLSWMEERQGDPDPFFAWVHFFDPHQPYEVDRAAAGSLVTLPSAYDAEIAAVDHALGRIVAALEAAGTLDETVVVVTTDHGESLGDHGERTHAVFVYDATIRAPLIIRHPPSVPAGRIVSASTSAIDVAPTALGLLGAPPLPAAQGHDHSEALQTGAPVEGHPQYIESLLSERGFGMAPLVGVREGGLKWIRAPRPERYDLRADPRELHNLHPDDPGPSAQLDATLQRLLDESAARAVGSSANPLDGETQEMLLAMGYLAPAADRAAVAGLDPKDGMPLHSAMEDARHALRRGRPADAEARLLVVLEALPANVSAWNVLGLARTRQGDLAGAREAYLRSLELDPRQHRALGMMGALHLQAGELDQARERLDQALAVTPGFVEAMLHRAQVETVAGDAAAAEQWAERAHAVDPTFPRGWKALGDLRFRQGRWDDARAWYERLLAQTPDHFHARVQAGVAAHRAARPDEARAHLTAAAEARPDAWEPMYNLACVESVAGRLEPALDALEQAAKRGLDRPALLDVDTDLATARGEPRFAVVRRHAAANAAAAPPAED